MYNNLETTIRKTLERIKELEESIVKTNDPAVKHRLNAELKIQKNSLEAYKVAGRF